jgi:predicted metal-dependent hydrolase
MTGVYPRVNRQAVIYHKFPYGSNFIEYSVIRSNRLKTSEVNVDEKGIVIRVPANKPDLEIHNILRRKKNWIIAKRLEYLKAKRQIKKSNFEMGSTLPYLGRNYKISKGFGNSKGRFLAFTNDFSHDNISNIYKKWLEQKSERIFRTKVAKYSKKLKIEPHSIMVKNLKKDGEA